MTIEAQGNPTREKPAAPEATDDHHTAPSVSQSVALPLVSIIIPTYNRRDLLPEAVASCLAQTWLNREIIIVDDGSADGTDRLVRERLKGEWSERGIRYVPQLNAGASAARNAGLALAVGDYVQFLDSDDLLFPDKLARQVEVLESSKSRDAAGCSCYGQIGPRISSTNPRIGVQCHTPQEYLHALCGRIVHGMQTSAPLWRRSFLTRYAGWRADINLGDDLEYHIRLLSQTRSFCFSDRVLFLVRQHHGPRLSDAHQNRQRLLSAIRTRESLYQTLQSADCWNVATQQAFLEAMRTLYANVLDCGVYEDIERLEAWLLELSHRPRRYWVFPLVIACRRVLGRGTVSAAHRSWMRFRRA